MSTVFFIKPSFFLQPQLVVPKLCGAITAVHNNTAPPNTTPIIPSNNNFITYLTVNYSEYVKTFYIKSIRKVKRILYKKRHGIKEIL